MKQTVRRFVVTIATLGALVFGAPTFAFAVNLNPLAVPIIQGTDLISVLGRIVDLVLMWGGIIAFFYALWGGFKYLTSGGDNKGADEGKKTLTNAIIGIIIIAISYVVVNYLTATLRNSFQGVPEAAVTLAPATQNQKNVPGNTQSQNNAQNTGPVFTFPAAGKTVVIPATGGGLLLPSTGESVTIPTDAGTNITIPGPGGTIYFPNVGIEFKLPMESNSPVDSVTKQVLYNACVNQGKGSNSTYLYWAQLCSYLIDSKAKSPSGAEGTNVPSYGEGITELNRCIKDGGLESYCWAVTGHPPSRDGDANAGYKAYQTCIATVADESYCWSNYKNYL